MGKSVIAGNWKMHMTCAEAQAFASAFLPLVASLPSDRQVLLAPPFTAIATLAQALAGSGIQLGGQNVHWDRSGAYTGMISAAMLQELRRFPVYGLPCLFLLISLFFILVWTICIVRIYLSEVDFIWMSAWAFTFTFCALLIVILRYVRHFYEVNLLDEQAIELERFLEQKKRRVRGSALITDLSNIEIKV